MIKLDTGRGRRSLPSVPSPTRLNRFWNTATKPYCFQKNLDVALGVFDTEISIVCIHPADFMNSLREAVNTGAGMPAANMNAHNIDVAGRRRPRFRGVAPAV